MRSIVSVSLPTKILNNLKSESKKENANLSEIIRRALSDYFFRTEFERLRKKAMLESAKRGIRITEEEILK